jgi:transcriptional regulator with XRE-family HTH domain
VVRKKNTQLGDRIRSARADRGWKQKHLAAEVSVEPITVSRWERGATTPDLDVLSLVADATGKPLSYFVDSAPATAKAPASLTDAAGRLESAAAQISEEVERLSAEVAKLRSELGRRRS